MALLLFVISKKNLKYTRQYMFDQWQNISPLNTYLYWKSSIECATAEFWAVFDGQLGPASQWLRADMLEVFQ